MAYCIFLVMNSFHKWNYLFLSLVFSIESFEGHLELGQKHTQLAIFMWESWTCHRWKSMLYYLCIVSKGDKKFISYRLSVTNSIKLTIFALLNKYFQTISKWNSDGSNTISSNIKQTRTSFFKHRTNSNMFIYCLSNLNIWILALIERPSNLDLLD